MSKFARTESAPRPHIDCAHTQCPHPALIERKVNGAWVKVCKAHDLFHVQQEADKFCRDSGLTTREAQKAYIREKLGKGILRHVKREPGQDDEERAA